MMITLELLGLAIFTQSLIPDIFGMPKSDEAESLIDIATIFEFSFNVEQPSNRNGIRYFMITYYPFPELLPC